MNVLSIARQSLKTTWTNKGLWFFGFFVAVAGGGGGGSASPATHAAGPVVIPWWLFAVTGATLVLGLAALVLHLFSEAALIKGVAMQKEDERLTIRAGLAMGRCYWGRVLLAKLLFGAVMLVAIALVTAPVGLFLAGVAPKALAIAVCAVLGIVAVPVLLSAYFIYQFALRFVVLGDCTLGQAIIKARRLLFDHLTGCCKLLCLGLLGQAGAGVVALIPLLIAAGCGIAAYAAGGLVSGIVAGGIIMVPVTIALVGALGTYQSALWTLGFIDAR